MNSTTTAKASKDRWRSNQRGATPLARLNRRVQALPYAVERALERRSALKGDRRPSQTESVATEVSWKSALSSLPTGACRLQPGLQIGSQEIPWTMDHSHPVLEWRDSDDLDRLRCMQELSRLAVREVVIQQQLRHLGSFSCAVGTEDMASANDGSEDTTHQATPQIPTGGETDSDDEAPLTVEEHLDRIRELSRRFLVWLPRCGAKGWERANRTALHRIGDSYLRKHDVDGKLRIAEHLAKLYEDVWLDCKIEQSLIENRDLGEWAKLYRHGRGTQMHFHSRFSLARGVTPGAKWWYDDSRFYRVRNFGVTELKPKSKAKKA